MSRPEARRFLRFYYPEFMRDYPDVYADDAAFSAFIRLLAAAEMAWPATPELPRSIRPKALRVLTARSLVKVSGHTFALKGFVKEREMRADSARNAAAQRWHSNSNADAYADAMPKRGEDEEKREAERGRRPLDGGPSLAVVKP